MKLEYIIDPRKFSKKQATMSQGIFYIKDSDGSIVFEHPAKSGGWGKGTLPTGDYKAVWYTEKTEPAFTQHGIGWLVSLVPQFETDRTELAIHPDGNVEGSLGCIVMDFKDVNINVLCRNMLRDFLEHGTMILTVSQLSIPQGV